MNKNTNTRIACGLVVRVAPKFLLMTGLLANAQAQNTPAEPQKPEVAPPQAVDVEVFQGVRILTTPAGNAYPIREVRDGREGWVRLNMMIDPKGRPYEVMVIDSSGSPAFEKAAVRTLDKMSFAPARRGDTPIDSSFTFKMKFSIKDLAKGATTEFVSAYRQFTKAIEAGDKDKADVQLTRLRPQNLYEDAFANYGKYFYHRKWGTPSEQLADLQLAVAGERRAEYLPMSAFRTSLIAMFALEVEMGDYGGALGTWNLLEPIAPRALRADLQRTVDQIYAAQLGNQRVTMAATIDETSNWNGTLFKNRFSVAVTSGSVSEIKLRCEKQYLFFRYEPGVEYSIGSKQDRCGIEVVGDPGTTFQLIQ